MTARWTALLLAFALLLPLGAAPARAESETGTSGVEAEAEPAGGEIEEIPEDPDGTLSFENLDRRMMAHYYPILSLQESIDDLEGRDYEWREDYLRTSINSLSGYQWIIATMSPLGTESSAYQSMQTQYDRMRSEFDDIRDGKTQQEDEDALRQYRNAQNQAVFAGETLYIALLDMLANNEALTRQIAQLDRTVRELELRFELGQVPELTVAQAKSGRAQAISGQKTLEMNINAYLLQLKSMVGAELDTPLSLGALPAVTQEQLDAMDLTADLKQAMEASYELFDAKKQLDDFRVNTYEKVIDSIGTYEKYFEVSQVTHALQAMQYGYDNTLLNYELNFRALFAQVGDCAQILEAKRTALETQESSYAVSQLKYEQGNISANALADAKDELDAARSAVSAAERELFSKYRSYCWAVEYGILNG
ncbi:MAG: TolC family protein [Oscillospiraceae bacterium]|nr:TolC family protein [Oscillospiraceae bacterium]